MATEHTRAVLLADHRRVRHRDGAVGLFLSQAYALAGIGFIVVMSLIGLRGVYDWVFEPLEPPAQPGLADA